MSDEQVFERSPETLLSEVASSYDLAEPSECALTHSGLNDVYLIKTSGDPVILKVYRAGWRERSELLYEIEVLLHLGRKRVPVSLPFARRDGSFLNSWPGPDGLSHAVLFTCARGEAVSRVDEQYCYGFGQAAAEMHQATGDFTSPYARFHLDLEAGDAWEVLERVNPDGSIPAMNDCFYLHFDPDYAHRVIAMPGLGEWWREQMTQRLEKQHEYWTETLKD